VGWLVLGEAPAPAALAGGALIILGGALVVRRPSGVSLSA
jgi:drug/metabolite transporter (DMT)-like permease